MNDRTLGTESPSCHLRLALAVLWLTSLFISGLSLTAHAAPQPANPQSSSAQAAQARGLNNALLRLHAQMQQASEGEVAGLRRQAATVIAQRAATLGRLIQTDPHAALSFAFSPELLADLAAKFPSSARLLESHVTVTGPVEHWVADYPNRTSRSWWLMKIGGGHDLNLYFAFHEPAQLKSGDFLQATGVVAVHHMAVESATRISATSAANLISTPLSSTSSNAAQDRRETHWRSPAALLFPLMMGMLLLPADVRMLRRVLGDLLKHVAVCGVAVAVFIFSSISAYGQNSCNTTGIQNTAVLIVTFPGITVPTFSPSLSDLFFGPAPSLTSYWQEASYNATSATGGVFGPFTLSGSYSCSTINQLIADSLGAAAVAGVDFNNYDRIDIVFPGMNPSCGWAGLSSIGCYSVTTSAGTFNLSTSVLLWSDLTPSYGLGLVEHENGHQIGLAHSRLRQFGTEPLGPLGTTGTLTEYGDHFAAMGYPNRGHYAAEHKAEILGWLAPSINYQIVQNSGTYTLQPYEINPAGLNALKIQRGTGNNAWLWVEYRQPLGNYDVSLPTQVYSGALIHYEDSVTGPQTDLLDFTAPSTYSDDPALAAGQTWTDPYTNLSLSVVSATSAGLTLNVNYGSVPCTATSPTVALSPLDPSIYPGNSASYALSVTNNDSVGCSSSTYSLSSAQPAGWPISFSVTSLTLSPGQSASATMTITGPSGTAPGTYPVSANAASNSQAGLGTANITVMSAPSLSVSISVSSSTFNRKSTVPITATVLSGGTPAAGASITFTLTTPTGSTVTQTATADSNGTATWSYKLSPRAPTGTYSVSAQAVLSSKRSAPTQPATSNTVSFTVQ